MQMTDVLIQELTESRIGEAEEASLHPAWTDAAYRVVRGKCWRDRGPESPGPCDGYFFFTNENRVMEQEEWHSLDEGCVLEMVGSGQMSSVTVIGQPFPGWYYLRERGSITQASGQRRR